MLARLRYIENNVIGLIILLIILLNLRFKEKGAKSDEKLFLALIVSNIMIMVLNISINILDGTTGFLLRETNIVLTTFYFILNPIPYLVWSLYVDYYIYKSARRLKIILPRLIIPAAISIIISIFSVFNKGVFYINQDNIYSRGSLFTVNALLYYSYFVYTSIKIMSNKRNLRQKDYYSLLIFAVPPAISGLLQITYFGRSYIWLSISISSLIVFISIQNNELTKDYLTGLYNRRQLDIYLENSIRNISGNEKLFMIMIDINDFKEINDKYGHIEGDQALKHTADILVESFRSEDFISRYAGDEFVVLLKLEEDICEEAIIDRLKENFDKFNEKSKTAYNIEISLGYDIYNSQFNMNANEFIMCTDQLMYQDKKNKL